MDLNTITRKKIDAKIVRGKQQASGSILRLIEDTQNAQDFILKLGSGCESGFGVEDDKVQLITGGDFKEYNLHDNAIGLLASKFKIPTKYLRELAGGTWGKSLSAIILNEHVANAKQDRFLVRAVENEIRAVLSDSFKRFDSGKIVESFIKTAGDMGAQFCGGHNNGINMWLEMIKPDPIEIQTVKNGIIQIGFGGRIETSDYGRGALNARGYILQGICLNGMVRENVLREIHLGGKLPEDIQFAQETVNAETKAISLKVRDVARSIFSEDYMRQKIWEIQKASGIEVDMTKELEKLQKGGRILKSEKEETEKILSNNRPEDGVQGAATLWKLTQGLTAMARNKDEERQRKLAEIAGGLLPNYQIQKPIFN